MAKFVGTFVSDGEYWYSSLHFTIPDGCKEVSIVARMRAEAAAEHCTANVWLSLSLNHPFPANYHSIGGLSDNNFSSTDLLLNPSFKTFKPGQVVYLKMQTGGQSCKGSVYTFEAETN